MKKFINYIAQQVYNEVGISLKEGITSDESLSATYRVVSELVDEEFAKLYITSLLEADNKVDPDTEVSYKNKDGDTKTTTYKTAIASDKESPQYKAADTLRNTDSKEDKEDDGTFSTADQVDMMTSAEKDAYLKSKEAEDKQSDSETDTPKERPEIPSNAKELASKDNEITDTQLFMTKTEANLQAKRKGAKDVGAGTPESRAGEAMVHKGLRLLQSGKSVDEIQNEFTKLVNTKDHILNSKSGKEWVTSCMASLNNIQETVGVENIETVSWDTPQGRESIGIDPKLETSSDMFVRTKDGKNIGLSLKKSGQVFLNNGGWAKQSEKLLGDLKSNMPEDDHKRLTTAMSIDSYKADLKTRFQKSTETVGVDEITSSLEKLKKENPKPDYFKNSDKYFPILENPEELVEKLKTGKLKGDEMKAYSKLLQYAHKEEYELLRGADGALTQRTFEAINSSPAAKAGMNKHIIKSMHIAETLGLNETIKAGGVDGFQTTYGIKPDGAVLNEDTLKTLLGGSFSKKLDEVIVEVRQGKASSADLENLISDSIEIDYDSGNIMFKHENNKKYPLFYMSGRTRGIGSSPVMEMAQTPFMAHALKMGTFNTDEWDENSLKRFEDEIGTTTIS